ncbi:MAG TPA: M23 family metallopeptidase [Gemmatimonadales bacterium]|nr:M23 family metallopeptidase [Gemmatimonadales bacterium]
MTPALAFPLRGLWTAIRTPAPGGPGHGTDFLGQRFAYDFVRPTGRPWAPYGAFLLAQAYAVVPASAFAAWDQPVHAAEGGRVVVAADGWPDRHWINGLWEFARLRIVERYRPIRITADDWRPLSGNHILVEGASGVAVYAHFRQGSVRVRPGDRVSTGDLLGAVGNSGRSTMPHLHFHLMDRADGLHASGIACTFTGLERRIGGKWVAEAGLPPARATLRSTP